MTGVVSSHQCVHMVQRKSSGPARLKLGCLRCLRHEQVLRLYTWGRAAFNVYNGRILLAALLLVSDAILPLTSTPMLVPTGPPPVRTARTSLSTSQMGEPLWPCVASHVCMTCVRQTVHRWCYFVVITETSKSKLNAHAYARRQQRDWLSPQQRCTAPLTT